MVSFAAADNDYILTLIPRTGIPGMTMRFMTCFTLCAGHHCCRYRLLSQSSTPQPYHRRVRAPPPSSRLLILVLKTKRSTSNGIRFRL